MQDECDISPEAMQLAVRAARQSLADFARLFWAVVNPGTPMLWNWHLDCICEHLEAVTRRELHSISISVPPGSCKSTIVGQMWPTWEWLRHPERRWVFATNALDNAKKEAIYRRSIIQSDLYRRFDPPFGGVLRTKNVLTVRNDRNGVYRGISTGSAITGDHFDVQVIDDPNDAQRISADELAMINFWYDSAFSSRRRLDAALVVIQQRLAPCDLVGHLRDLIEFDAIIDIPMQYDPKHISPPTKLGWVDPRVKPGQLLWPAKYSKQEIQTARKTLGEAGYRAQYQQRPIALGVGETFRRTWWQRWSDAPRDIISWICTIDTASSMRQGADNSVVEVWALSRGGVAYLTHLEYGHWDIQTKIRKILGALDMFPHCRQVAVEERGEGYAVADSIDQSIRPSGRIVKRWTSRAPKESRIAICAPLVESGHIVVPEGPMAEPLIEEAAQFPLGDHDDMIDAMAMMVSIWSRDLMGSAWADEARRVTSPDVEALGNGAVMRRTNLPTDQRIRYDRRLPNQGAAVGGARPRKVPVWYH